MARALRVLVLGILAGGIGMGAAAAKDEPATPAAPAASAAQEEEKIIYTFSNEDQMKTFAQLWQQRRGMLVRMSVLKAYFDEEQIRLQELDQKLSADYKIDVNKNYVLDSKRRVILETAAATEETSAAPAVAPPASP